MKRLCLGLLVALFLWGNVYAQDSLKNRWNPVRLQLVGPLDSVTIHCGSAGETFIELSLLDGERRSIQVPLAVSPGFVDPEKDLSWSGAGSVLWPDATGFQVPGSLRSSNLPLPVVPNPVPILAVSSVLALMALALLLFFLRGKPGLRMGAACVGSALLLLQAGFKDTQEQGLVRIIEINGARPWKVLDSGRDVMGHLPGQAIRLSVKPASRALTWWVTEHGGNIQVQARSKGALLRKEFPMKPGMRSLDAELNALGNLEQVWVREESGRWSARGPWVMGTALPAANLDLAGPPGWLVSGLPQGPTIWVARFAAGTQPAGAGGPATQTWLRLRLDT